MSAPPPAEDRTAFVGPARPISPRTLRWEERSAWPLFALSVAFFAAWVLFLSDRTLTTPMLAAVVGFIVVSWAVFIADYIVRLLLSGNRRAFLQTRWFEGVSLVIAYLRPFVILAYLWRLPWFRESPRRQRLRLIVMVTGFTFLFVFVGSTLVWLAERADPRANILDLGDAIWWGFSTVATVGYGDFVPVTPWGRTIAVGLMMGGLVVLGVTSATVVSALTDQIHRTAERQGAANVVREASGAVPDGATGELAPHVPPGTPR